MVLWDNFHVKVVKKAEICEKLLKMLKKCGFGSQDDVIGPKKGKIFEKNLFQTNLLSYVNNIHHGFMG